MENIPLRRIDGSEELSWQCAETYDTSVAINARNKSANLHETPGRRWERVIKKGTESECSMALGGSHRGAPERPPVKRKILGPYEEAARRKRE